MQDDAFDEVWAPLLRELDRDYVGVGGNATPAQILDVLGAAEN